MHLIVCRKELLSFISELWRLYKRNLLMMKLTAILTFAACLQLSAKGVSQNITLAEHQAPLKKVLKDIRRQSGYVFFYEDRLLEKSNPVDLTIKNRPLTDVLNLVFQDQPLTYEMMGNVIVVREKAPVRKPVSDKEDYALPPPVKITGVVKDQDGAALEGASISVKGGTTVVASRADGTFEIEVPGNKSVLVVSFVGYNTREIVVGENRNIVATLSRTVSQLEDMVVIGYGTQRKRDLTGSISSVKGEELARMPNTNPVSSLQGRIAGLTIVNSGRAGSSPTVRIRGVNSTNNSNALYVVDGVFQTNIDFLNPMDIDRVEVLRDPSSLAIFGLQGGNGVIILTTKKAAKGETRTSFQSSVGLQRVNNQIKVADAAGFRKLYSAQLANLNAAPFDFTNYTANTNWQDIIFRDAIVNNNTLTVSNTGEKTTTLFSIGYNKQQGVLKYDEYDKYIGRLNQELKISKNIKIGGEITGFHWIQDNPGADLNNALWAAPIVPVQAGDGLYYSMPSFQRAQVSNPKARMDLNTGNAVNKGYRGVANIYGEIKFLKQFTWRSSFYADLGFNGSRSYSPLPYTFINLGEGLAKTDTTFDKFPRTGVTQSQSESRRYQQDHTITFDKTFNSDHHITALAGFTTLYEAKTNLSGSRKDTSLNLPRDPDYWYLNIVNLNNPLGNSGDGYENAYMSYLGRINYSFRGKYLVNATYRRDGSSKFGRPNRWGNFGSVGAGWVISEEPFLKDIKQVNFLKLRAAWGTTGSALGFPPNLYRPGVSTRNSGVFGDNVYPAVVPDYVPDPNLHWEVVRGADLGIEWRVLGNRLSSEITIYDRRTTDILTTVTLPGTAGDYKYMTNLGTISNKGVEISLGWNDRIGRDFRYAVNGNISYNDNTVVSIGNKIDFEILGNNGVNRTVSGSSIGYFYGYRQVGIYQTVADLDKRPAMSTSLPGDIAYADINGDGKIDPSDRAYLGTPFPPYSFGASLNLGYKAVDFVLDLQGVAGNKIYTQRRTSTFAVLNYEANRLNAWAGPGTTNIEPILDNTRANNFLFSSYYLEPGDYLRLRTLQVGYNFSAKTVGNIPIKQLRLYLGGQNLATFSKTTGYTPEASISNPVASGADNGTYPVPAIYTVGLNLVF